MRWGLVLVVALAGCPRAEEVREQRPGDGDAPKPRATEPALQAAPGGKPLEVSWRAHLGKCVVVEGHLTESRKTGAALVHPKFRIGVIPKEEAGTSKLVGGHVRVKGVVGERSDLPVFIPKKGEPVPQGMPVPEGTDLDEARKRFVIEAATVTRLRRPEQVEAALDGQLGKVVTLPGILWSLNGHWWFAHDGIDMHVDGLTDAPGWSADRHGQPVAVQGKLGRKPLPRIDQISLKPDRDLAEAYFLGAPLLKPHPAWPLRSCQK